MRKKFINCGFEFTASVKVKGKMTNLNLEFDSFYDDYSIVIKTYNEVISNIDWIDKNFETDSCGCEIPTPIATSEQQAIKYFNQFKRFVDKSNLTIDIDESIKGLGGCHIHMNLSNMGKVKKKLFMKNIAIFLTNNPQLNWGFNDHNDNENANSLLSRDYKSCYVDNGVVRINSEPLINYWLKQPLMSLDKEFAFRFNKKYQTVELRIFDMPKSLSQHKLHIDVAQAIYNYCLRKTNKKELFELKYHKMTDYKMDCNHAILSFNKVIKTLGINPSRTKAMVKNIITRHEWTGCDYHNTTYANFLL